MEQPPKLPRLREGHPYRHGSVTGRPPYPRAIPLPLNIDGSQHTGDSAVQPLEEEHHCIADRGEMIQQQHAGVLVRGSPEPRTCRASRHLRRMDTRIRTLERTRDVIEAGRDSGIRARNSGNQKLRVQPRKKSGLAAAARTEKSQMLATQEPLLQLGGELGRV
jgi:hypothetical protein